jgi:hypothetical protein
MIVSYPCHLVIKEVSEAGHVARAGAGHEPRHQDAELKPEGQLTRLLHGSQLRSCATLSVFVGHRVVRVQTYKGICVAYPPRTDMKSPGDGDVCEFPHGFIL